MSFLIQFLTQSLKDTRSIFNVFRGIISAFLLSMAVISSASAVDVPTLYKASCAVCHDSGALNAPKKGDKTKWETIKKKGMPALVNGVKSGMMQMPAGGLCADCKDEDYRQLIEYMSQ
ncbi:c-type cytochrome [Psychrobacter sp. 16-MNA-CIBAN-0192]|uniref:c-type cytochrome n=1 Tax=Psychrobacter sp. 16-MNA-CIBAN-0192 TaxID=3140448 RepID=UPI00332CAB0A